MAAAERQKPLPPLEPPRYLLHLLDDAPVDISKAVEINFVKLDDVVVRVASRDHAVVLQRVELAELVPSSRVRHDENWHWRGSEQKMGARKTLFFA